MGAYNKVFFEWVPRQAERLLRRASLQRALEYIHMLTLHGMNLGGGASVASSGELSVLRWVADATAEAAGHRVVVDVGANHGDYALAAARAFAPGDIVHGFEPSSAARAILSKQPFPSDRAAVRIHPCGLSDKPGRLELFSTSAGEGTASLHAENARVWGSEYGSQVEVVDLQRLDDSCAEQKIERIHLLKMDVEGHELRVLEGARGMLEQRRIERIQFEFGPANIGSRTFFVDFWHLLSKDYVIYRILPRALVRVDDYKTAREVFLTTNFLAVTRTVDDATKRTRALPRA